MKITITGTGNASHAFISLLGNSSNDITVFTKQIIPKEIMISDNLGNVGSAITTDMEEEAFGDSELVIVTNPGDSSEYMYDLIRSYNSDVDILFSPGQNGLSTLTSGDKNVTALSPMPFNCRIKEKFRTVDVLGIKTSFTLFGKDLPLFKIFPFIDEYSVENLYDADFIPLNSIIHTVRLTNLFLNKEYLEYNPLFYEEMSIVDTSLMGVMSDEFTNWMNEEDKEDYHITKYLPEYVYRHDGDLLDLFNNHPIYKGLKSPLVEIDGKFYMDKKSRYLTEDLHNLKCVKNKLRLRDMKTPYIDYVLKEMEKLNEKAR